MVQGVIIKALSGFYYVAAGDQIVECKARGRFRYDGCSPLVGDRVEVSFDAHGKGRIDTVLPRRNAFIRPAVANIDQLIMIAANVNPVTDPFLIDRVVAIAENADCEPVVCLNKCDLDPADHLYAIYRSIGFRVLRTSAATGLGVDELRDALRGKTSAFTGNSGVGKSTLLNCIATVIAPSSGAVALHDKCITTLHGKALADYRGKEIGYLFQSFELIDNLTGRENILLPLALHGVSEGESRERLTKLADYLEVTDVLDKFPAQMSGGQKQRIAAARALILGPEIVLADEPTGALDSKNARSLMEKLSGLNADAGTTILMVTHDCNAASYCKRILFIQDGVLFHELRRDVPDETQQEFYGRILAVMAQLGGGSANVL